MAAKKLAQVFVSFAACVETFEQPFNRVGHGVRGAAIAYWARDARELADAAADAEVIGVDHFAVLLDFLALDADVGDPVLAATVGASGDVQLELLFEGGQTLFEFLGQPARKAFGFGQRQLAEFGAGARNSATRKNGSLNGQACRGKRVRYERGALFANVYDEQVLHHRVANVTIGVPI